MSKTNFVVPRLVEAGAWVDMREDYPGGFGWRGDRPLDSVVELAMHHSVSNVLNDARREVDAIARTHLGTNGWGGIGYNIIVSSEEVNGYAKACYVGDLGSVRAHTPNTKGALGYPAREGNWYIAAICFVGRFDGDIIPTDAQLRTMHEITKELIYGEDSRFPKLKDWSNLRDHKIFDYTACAGKVENYRDLVIDPPKLSITPPDMDAPFKPGSEEVKSAINWQKNAVAKAKKTPLGENEVLPIISNVTDENLVRPMSLATFLVLIQRYNYIQGSIELGRLEQKIEELMGDEEKLDEHGIKMDILKTIYGAIKDTYEGEQDPE